MILLKLKPVELWRALKAQKVEIYILTGDSEDVTAHLCNELNLSITGILTGKEMATLDDYALHQSLLSCYS